MPENSIYMYSLSVDQIYKKLNFYAIGICGYFMTHLDMPDLQLLGIELSASINVYYESVDDR